MKLFAVLACCIAVACAIPADFDEWESFKATHGKVYQSPEEENFRLGVYLSNKQMIEEHNKKFYAGLVSFELGMNHFGDRLHQEVTQLNGLNKTALLNRKSGGLFKTPRNFKAPSSLDWRESGYVSHVKNQGACGSCWAFSATGSLEGQMFKKTGNLVPLSEQNLIDCSYEQGNEGCSGGMVYQAFDYVIENGLDSEESYPYEARGGQCRFSSSDSAATVTTYHDVPDYDEEALKNAVASIGPISISIDAGIKSFQFYKRGVYSEPYCDPEDLDHGVLAVGYGSENGQDYWLVKNSWGPAWGDNGYIKIARNKGNMCGVATMPYYPVV